MTMTVDTKEANNNYGSMVVQDIICDNSIVMKGFRFYPGQASNAARPASTPAAENAIWLLLASLGWAFAEVVALEDEDDDVLVEVLWLLVLVVLVEKPDIEPLSVVLPSPETVDPEPEPPDEVADGASVGEAPSVAVPVAAAEFPAEEPV